MQSDFAKPVSVAALRGRIRRVVAGVRSTQEVTLPAYTSHESIGCWATTTFAFARAPTSLCLASLRTPLLPSLSYPLFSSTQISRQADNVCELLVEVHARLLITLRRKCFEYVLANHGVVSSSAAYARLPPSLLQEISTATGEESG